MEGEIPARERIEATITLRGEGQAHCQAMPALTVAAIGVVFGDIGTSPRYALKEIFNGHHPIPVTPDNILGVLSLVFWAIMIMVTIKYVLIICAPTTAARAARWRCSRWSSRMRSVIRA